MIQSIASFYNSSELSLSSMMFLFVLLVEHSGMLRADDLLSIRYRDIDFFEDRMVIFMAKRKNNRKMKVTLVILKGQLNLHVQFHL